MIDLPQPLKITRESRKPPTSCGNDEWGMLDAVILLLGAQVIAELECASDESAREEM